MSASRPRRRGFSSPRPRPSRQAIYAYAGAIPGPLIKLRQGEEVKLKLVNRLAEPTTLSFPGLRAANAAAGVGGLTQARLKPGASAEIRFVAPDPGFNLYLPHAGVTDAGQQGRGLFGPIIVEEAIKPDVDLDAAIVSSDWNVDANGRDQGRLRRSGDRARKRAKGRPHFRQWRSRAAEAQRPARRARAPASRQRRDRASGDHRHRGRERPSSSPSTASRASRSNRCGTSSRWAPAPVSS